MTVSADGLHLLVHRAALRARTEEDWWDSPLDTALAAVAAVRHDASHRGEAESASEAVSRWHRDGEPRRISADVTALALGSRAARDVSRRDAALESAAIEAVDDLARRGTAAVPALHLALSAWGLDSAVSSRADSPWPAIRQHVAQARNTRGTDAPLRTVTAMIASEALQASHVSADLLGQVTVSPGLDDAAPLLWALTVALERLSSELPADDSGMIALTERRSALVKRLAEQLDERAFSLPEVGDLHDEDYDVGPVVYASPMDALLIDICLAPVTPETPWLTFREARSLFGQRERRLRARLARTTSILLWIVGLVTSALVAVSLGWADVKAQIVFSAAIFAFGASGTAAVGVLYHHRPRKVLTTAIALTVTAAVLSALMCVNAVLRHPLLPDFTGLAAGALLGALVAFIVSVLAPEPAADLNP